MLGSIAKKLFGTANDRIVKTLQPLVEQINALEPEISKLSDPELQNQTDKLRTRLKNGESLDDVLPEAFATMREAGKRVMGMRHFDVQLIGGMILHKGMISEMRTGEGKTLVATLAAYLNAIEGKGVHVVTVNDYLAKRDSEWMGKLYRFLGLSVGCIVHGLEDEERKAAYNADITYGTNNEFGFDFLRDNMKFYLEQMVQRPFNFAIVDEVDSILIDEARTPLIISGPSEDNSDLYVKVNKLIPLLTEKDYELDEKGHTVTLNEEGSSKVEELLLKNGLIQEGTSLYDVNNLMLANHVNLALKAHKLFDKDDDYIVKDNRIVIIDEFTGRMMEGRRYSEGIHQSIEAKENVPVQNENQTLASITFQNYFRMYPKLSGMTGTAMTEANEFKDIYKLDVIEIPTHMPVKRKDSDDEIYRTLDEKDNAIFKLIEECYGRKQPVLVGTVSIEKSEYLAAQLKIKKIPHQVLNARYHEREAHIIAQAGRPGGVTIATNMAGRGTDIMLGGNPEMLIEDNFGVDATEAQRQSIQEQVKKDKETVIAAGGLYVIGTERHESRRIDNQLRGRSGRQGDPGASKFFLSLQDDLMRIFGTAKMDAVMRMGLKEGEAIYHPWMSKALEKAQQRVEAHNYEIRKNLLKFDDVMNDQRKVIYDQRKEVMKRDDVTENINEMKMEVLEDIVAKHIPEKSYIDQWDLDGLQKDVYRVLNLDLPIKDWAAQEGIADKEIYTKIKDAFDNLIKAKEEKYGKQIMQTAEKRILLMTLDQLWKDHLLSLDHLRQGINLRAYGQKDPLNEYKREAFVMFHTMLEHVKEAIIGRLSHLEINMVQAGDEEFPAPPSRRLKETRVDPAMAKAQQEQQAGQIKSRAAVAEFDQADSSTWGRVGRNDPCPCGSGKKYKHCHGTLV